MEANDFCYWLKGWLELSDAKTMDEKQVETLRKHLDLVMINVTGCSEKKTEDSPKGRPGVTPSLFPSRKLC